MLVAAVAADEWITRHAEGSLYAGRVVVREQTPYQHVIITRHPATGEHRLYLDGHVQFAAFDEHRYHEALTFTRRWRGGRTTRPSRRAPSGRRRRPAC